jgi:hypothetical protein
VIKFQLPNWKISLSIPRIDQYFEMDLFVSHSKPKKSYNMEFKGESHFSYKMEDRWKTVDLCNWNVFDLKSVSDHLRRWRGSSFWDRWPGTNNVITHNENFIVYSCSIKLFVDVTIKIPTSISHATRDYFYNWSHSNKHETTRVPKGIHIVKNISALSTNLVHIGEIIMKGRSDENTRNWLDLNYPPVPDL